MNEVRIRSGSAFAREVKVYSDSSQLTPLDISGTSATFTVYDAPNGEVVLDGDVLYTDAVNGIMIISIPGADTVMDHIAVLYGQVVFTDTDASVWVIDEFKLVIE